MAIKKATYRFDNGISFDEIMFKTTADQVFFSDGKGLQEKLDNGEFGGGEGGGSVDLSDYATKEELTAYATKVELTNYATKNELSTYATKSELTSYATQSSVDTAINGVEAIIDTLPEMTTGLNPISIWYGSQAEYDSIATKNPNTLYIVT